MSNHSWPGAMVCACSSNQRHVEVAAHEPEQVDHIEVRSRQCCSGHQHACAVEACVTSQQDWCLGPRLQHSACFAISQGRTFKALLTQHKQRNSAFHNNST